MQTTEIGMYQIPTREIARYRQHGIAKISLDALRPFPLGNHHCQLGIEPLMEIKRPTEAWVRRGISPAIIVSSGTQKVIDGMKPLKSRVVFDTGREMEPVLSFKSHTDRANEVELGPSYKRMPKGELMGAETK
jgi:hypothetical protein